MNCIYLIQSDKPEIPYNIPEGQKSLLLQWSKNYEPRENSFHFPNSSWAEGRNELLRRALEDGLYDYYIFIDDDLKLYFSLETFEKFLSRNKEPRVAPYVPHVWNETTIGPSEQVKYVDHCFLAIRHDCIIKTLPYSLEWDKINWWLTCERMCEKMWETHPWGTIRLNQLVMLNQKHREYPKKDYPGFPENISRPHENYVHPFKKIFNTNEMTP